MARWSSLFLLCVIGLAKATTIDIDGLEEEDGEERTVFTSGGTYYIALNTTYLLYYSLLAGTLLLAGLALSGLFTGSAESTSGYGQQYGYQQKQGQGQGQGGFARNKRYAEGFTDQLNLLAEAFHKYEIDETNGCQLYVACESSDIAMHRKNGPLAKTVYHAMKNIAEPQNTRLYEDDKYLMDIMSAFKIGSSGQSCQQFRKQCRKEKVFLG
eukprot:TRINITY_DN632_c1_g1_i1.p1 TRINITY_DN632_c1_g1~~TRINITY_DN632_c1_g1_i1.p1  ORF type:complete len:212 (-),score=46.45 TRINITY_DN632_c1_g1_i1:405-1040(-)